MIELLGIFWLTRRTSRLAVSKGYSKWYGAFVPLMWVLVEFSVMLVVQALIPDANVYVLMFAGVLGGIAGGTLVYFRMSARPSLTGAGMAQAPGVPVASPGGDVPVSGQPAGRGAQALAGYCEACGAITWLTADGECEKGHGSDPVSGVHWALRDVPGEQGSGGAL